MRLYAKNCREKAQAFGNLLADYPPQQRRMITDCVMLEIWLGNRRYYDRDVALLLTNAFEAAGKKRKFTEDQVKKQRQRYVVPRVKLYLKSHPDLSISKPEKGTITTP